MLIYWHSTSSRSFVDNKVDGVEVQCNKGMEIENVRLVMEKEETKKAMEWTGKTRYQC